MLVLSMKNNFEYLFTISRFADPLGRWPEHADYGSEFAPICDWLWEQRDFRHAVNQAEVNRLGTAALIAGDGIRLDTKDLGSGGAVDVLSGTKSRQQTRIL